MSTDEGVRHALAALADVDVNHRAPQTLERAVLDAFDRKQRRGFVFRTCSTFWGHRYEALGTATAAAIALTVYAQWRSPANSAEPLRIQDPIPAVTATIASNPLDLPTPLVAAVAARPPTPTRRVRSTPEPVATTSIDSVDVVHAVHVQVSRTMLPLLGIPIIDPDAPGTVNVEFLLGNDGLARTIRIHQ